MIIAISLALSLIILLKINNNYFEPAMRVVQNFKFIPPRWCMNNDFALKCESDWVMFMHEMRIQFNTWKLH